MPFLNNSCRRHSGKLLLCLFIVYSVVVFITCLDEQTLEVNTDEALSLRARSQHRLHALCSKPSAGDEVQLVSADSNPQIAGRFSTIYANGLWGGDNAENGQGSGPGSSLAATITLRVIMEALVYRYGITSILDSPCGSSNWWDAHAQRQLPLLARLRTKIPCFKYTGVDVVESVIKKNTERFAGDALTRFAVGDITTIQLPKGYDLLLCRDALQHLPLSEGVRALRNIAQANAKYVAIGSYHDSHGQNKNVPPGDYFSINLLEAPFLLPEPLDVFDERSPGACSDRPGCQPVKYLLIYKGSQLAALDFDSMERRV